MIETLSAPQHVLALRCSGTITRPDIALYRRMLQERLESGKEFALYVEMTELSDIDPDAFLEGTIADLTLLVSHRLYRYAIVADRRWPHALLQLFRPLAPSVEARVFRPGERQQAMEWAGRREERPAPGKPAVRFLSVQPPEVLAMEIDGALTFREMPELLGRLEARLQQRNGLRLLVRLRRFEGFDLALLADARVLAAKLRVLRRLERYALVGAPDWLRGTVHALDRALPEMEMRVFRLEEEAQAWSWLEAREVPA